MIRICAWAASLAMVAVVVGAAVGFGFTFVPAAAASLENVPADPPPPLPDRTGVWPVNFTCYGNVQVVEDARPVTLNFCAGAGLGGEISYSAIREPGPTLVVLWGTNVTLTLIGHGLTDHSCFIVYKDDQVHAPAEPVSPIFNSP